MEQPFQDLLLVFFVVLQSLRFGDPSWNRGLPDRKGLGRRGLPAGNRFVFEGEIDVETWGETPPSPQPAVTDVLVVWGSEYVIGLKTLFLALQVGGTPPPEGSKGGKVLPLGGKLCFTQELWSLRGGNTPSTHPKGGTCPLKSNSFPLFGGKNKH